MRNFCMDIQPVQPGMFLFATGTSPSHHGIVSDVVYRRDQRRIGYPFEDASFRLLPLAVESSTMPELTYENQVSVEEGMSPLAIQGMTISDMIKIAQPRTARAFSVAWLAPYAVAMSGQSGQAYWFSAQKKVL